MRQTQSVPDVNWSVFLFLCKQNIYGDNWFIAKNWKQHVKEHSHQDSNLYLINFPPVQVAVITSATTGGQQRAAKRQVLHLQRCPSGGSAQWRRQSKSSDRCCFLTLACLKVLNIQQHLETKAKTSDNILVSVFVFLDSWMSAFWIVKVCVCVCRDDTDSRSVSDHILHFNQVWGGRTQPPLPTQINTYCFQTSRPHTLEPHQVFSHWTFVDMI